MLYILQIICVIQQLKKQQDSPADRGSRSHVHLDPIHQMKILIVIRALLASNAQTRLSLQFHVNSVTLHQKGRGKQKQQSSPIKYRYCTVCPVGYKCQDGSTDPIPCIKNREYSSLQGSSACIQCPGGFQCPKTNGLPIKCQDGYFSLESEGVCRPCPAGYSCLESGTQPVQCKVGQYSLRGEASCSTCPRGYQCNDKKMATKCKPGYYSQQGAVSCFQCPSGYQCEKAYFSPVKCQTPQEYSLPASIKCQLCPENHECAVSSSIPQPCKRNQQSKKGQGLCKDAQIYQNYSNVQIYQQRYLSSDCADPGEYKDDSDICIPCPAGFDCNDGHYFLRACPPGSYSVLKQMSCTICPSGSQCPSATSLPTECDAGQFSLAGQISCTQCPPGFQCPNKQGTSIAFCLSGKYSTGKQTACLDCPIDKYCNAFEAIDCNSAMYSPLGDYNCYWCPPGYSCNKTLGTKTACSNGEYSLEKSLSCTVCPAGFRCHDKGAAPYPCQPNTFSTVGSVTCTVCDAGKYSFIGWSECLSLPPGYYVDNKQHSVPQLSQFGKFTSDGRSLGNCAAGKVCGEGATSNDGDRDCPAGHYCKLQNNFVGIYPCPQGKYKPTKSVAPAETDCQTCPAGKYCPPGTITPKDCLIGYYCDAGTQYATQKPCPDNKWSTANTTAESNCFDCPDGYKCQKGIKNFCQPGHYCKGTVTQCPIGTYQPYTRKTLLSECLTCPKGHFCDETKMHTPKPCPAGTYNHQTGQNNVSACKSCAAGSVCPHPITKYQNDGTLTPQRFPCQPGHFCPANSENPLANPCPAHYYSDSTKLKSAGQCTRCPEGFWCPEGATFFGQASKNVLDVDNNPGNKPILCPEGWYCPNNNDAKKCPPGSWNPTRGAFGLEFCKPCPAGYTCAQGTGSKPTLCNSHSYCPPGSSSSISCPTGTYSPHDGTIWPNYMAAGDVADCFANHPGKYNRNEQCPINYYNPFFWGSKTNANVNNRGCWKTPQGFSTNNLTGQLIPSPCPIGKYSVKGNSCKNCRAGYYCDQLGLGRSIMLAEKECPDGYYCPGGPTLQRIPCPIGKFCSPRSSAPTNCSAGTWSFTTRQGGNSCPSIIAGYYHQTIQHKALLCPQGKYCPGGNTQSNLQNCPSGKFNPYVGAKSADYCVPCPIGFRCKNAATVNPQICPKGSYCERGAINGTPCPAGSFSNSFGLKKEDDCIKCYSGSYCQGTGNTSSSSNKCQAGFICRAGSTSPRQQPCPKYAYCPEGIPVETNCLPGKFNSSTGKALQTDCQTCPAGSFCTGVTDPQQCPAGYYCKAGSSTQFQNVAEVGHKALAGSSDQQVCQNNKYNFDTAQSSCKQCPSGYRCSGGLILDMFTQGTAIDTDDDFNQYKTISQSAQKCLSGKMNLFQNAQDTSDCVPCLPGFKCGTGMILKTQDVILTTAKFEGGKYGWQGVEQTTPAGFFTQTSAASYQFPCPAGAVQSGTGNTSSACTPLGSGLASLGGYAYGVSCADGFQCQGGSKHWNPAPCEVGYKCVQGQKTKCAAGEYQPIAGKSYCLPVKKGFYRGSGDSQPKTCSAGNYCPQGASAQIPCPDGFYNKVTGRYKLEHCLKCDPGFYCAQGTSNPLKCPAGSYCTIQAGSSFTGNCTAGHFCPQQSVYQQKCTPGSYCQTANLSAVTNPCRAGYYCLLGATKETPTNLISEGGEQCPAGTFCLEGSAIYTECPPGTFSSTVGATLSSDCQNCTPGKYCDKPKQTAVQGDCAAQFYCEAGAKSKFSKPCTAGSKCVAGSSAPLDCLSQSPKGYQPKQRSDFCITCPNGFTCTNKTKTECDFSKDDAQNKYCSNAEAKDCPAGKFIDFPGAGQQSECLDCPPGLYCDNGANKFQNCKGGLSCEGGSSAISGVNSAPKCPPGSYCPAGKRKLLCQAGKYCGTQGLESPTGACIAGYECPEGTVSGTSNRCPKGAYCPQGSAFGIKCPPGTYLDQEGKILLSDCKSCENLTDSANKPAHCKGRGLTEPNATCQAGYYCDQGSLTEYEHLCPKGSHCPVNTKNPVACSANTYQGAQGQQTCFDCPIGYECDGTGRTGISICTAGNQCPIAGAAKQPCPAGTFGAKQGLNACTPCTPGSYCNSGSSSVTGNCSAGYVCLGGASTPTANDGVTGKICPKGYYCQAGTMKELPCLPRTYGSSTGLRSASQCSKCQNGKYCPKYAMLDTELNTFKCWPGYLCNDGSQVPNPTTIGGRKCRKGTFCGQGSTVETKCNNGTYNALEGQSTCVQCPRGFQCSWNTDPLPNDISILIDSATPKACPAGKYCPAGSITGTDCPAGTYNDQTKISTIDQCKSCPPGKYCEAGSTGLGLNDCDAGYACPGGASVAAPSSATYSKSNNPRINGKCPKGHKCPSGTSIPTPCERGKYQPQTTQFDCLDCPQGKYCPQIGLWDESNLPNCADRYHCKTGAVVSKPIDGPTGNICQAGNYCEAGLQKQCQAGTFQRRQGSKKCQDCPAGYYCPKGSSAPQQCPIGSYCPEKSQEAQLCKDGTISKLKGLQKQQQCRPCPQGSYCEAGVQKTCDAGYYCKTHNLSAKAQNCKPGQTECPEVQNTLYLNGLCPKQRYCNNPTTKFPQACPDNAYRTERGATQQSDCKPCQNGYVCRNDLPEPLICPKGHYCTGGSLTACLFNSYNQNQGSTSQADCTECNALQKYFGKTFCDGKAPQPPLISIQEYLCPVGKFCKGKAGQPGALSLIQSCPIGTFSAQTGAKDECKSCKEGFYCDLGTIVPTPCDAGYYCPLGTTEQIECPQGYYCEEKSSTYKICPAAYYCPAGTIIPIKCSNGTYCPAGSSSPTLCRDGNYGTNNPNNVSAETGCISCDRGTFTEDNGVTECQLCTPGYVCTGGTISSKPTNPATDFGYICPIGHYCPLGSFKEKACPPGKYNSDVGQSELADCHPCQVGTYNAIAGQAGCQKCGASAFSVLGAIQCSCVGANRIYQEESGACICATGFTIKQGDDVDSIIDCIPQASDSCASGFTKNQRNQCVSLTDCSSTCENGVGGQRIEGVGFCNCNQVQDVDTVCNEQCRNSQKKVAVNNKGMVTVNGGSQFNLLADVPGMVGQYSPCSTEDQQCKMVSIQLSESTGVSASYTQHSGVFGNRLLLQTTQSERSLQTSSNSIKNPIVCIHTEDTFIFNIQITNNRAQSLYPVYVQSSLLNSDKSFDNSAFLKLQDRILNTSDSITFFAYQFKKSGLFVFSTSRSSSSYMIVRVLPQSHTCPNSSQFIQPTTEQNLYSIGVKKQAPTTTKSNWLIYGMMLLSFLIILLGFFLLISIFHSKAIAREKQALLSEEQKQVTFFQRICPCLIRRKRMQIGTEELAQKQLTLDELREIKDLAADLKQRLVSLYEQKDDQFEEVFKHARKMDKKLKRIAENYQLKPQDGLMEIQQKKRNKLFESGLFAGIQIQEDQIQEDKGMQQQKAQMRRKYEDKKFEDKLQKQVQQNVGQIEMLIGEQHKNDIEDLRKNLDQRLAGMEDLTAEEKRQLLLEQQTNLVREENLLKAEAKKQEDQMRKKLAQRKAKRKLLQNKIDEEAQRKKQVEENYQEDLMSEKKRAEKDIQQLCDLDKLKEKQLKLVKKEFQQKREGIKDDMKDLLQQRLNKTKVSQRPQLLEKFDQEQQEIMKKLEKEKKDRQEMIKDNIEDIARQKKEQRKKEFEEAKELLMSQRDLKIKDIDNEISKLEKLQENEKVDQYINKLDIIQEERKRKDHLMLKRQHQKQLKELKRKQREALEREDNELKSTQQQLEHASGQNNAIREEISQNQEKRESLQNKLKELQNKSDPDSEKEKQRLLVELSQFDKAMFKLEHDLNNQKSKIQEKLLARKQKLRNKIQKRDKFDKEIEQMMDVQKEEDLNTKLQRLNQEFHIKLERIQTDLEKEELTYAFEKLIDDKQAEELKILLAILLNEKFEKMKLILDKLFQNKLDELTIIKDEFRPKIQQLQDDKQKGRISSTQQYNQRFKQIKEEQVERKKDLDLKYFELQNDAQERVNSDLEQIHEKRVIQLKQKQIQEKNKFMKKMIARQSKYMKVLEQQRREAMQRQLEVYQNQMKKRLKHKMEQKEIQRAKLIQMSKESEQRLRQFQQQSHKSNIEHENRQRERMEKRRAELEKRKNQVNQDLKNRTDLSQQMKKQLLAKHQMQMKQLQNALQNERKRQLDIMGMKLNQRKIFKQKKREEKDRKLMAYKLHKEQKIDKKLEEIKLPQISSDKSQFEKVSNAYIDNIRIFDKLKFPSSLKMNEELSEARKKTRTKRGSVASSSDRKLLTPQHSASFAFRTKKKKTDLEAVLARLCDIEEMLNKV